MMQDSQEFVGYVFDAVSTSDRRYQTKRDFGTERKERSFTALLQR